MLANDDWCVQRRSGWNWDQSDNGANSTPNSISPTAFVSLTFSWSKVLARTWLHHLQTQLGDLGHNGAKKYICILESFFGRWQKVGKNDRSEYVQVRRVLRRQPMHWYSLWRALVPSVWVFSAVLAAVRHATCTLVKHVASHLTRSNNNNARNGMSGNLHRHSPRKGSASCREAVIQPEHFVLCT